MVAVRPHSATQGTMQVKHLNCGINHNHTLNPHTEILIKAIAHLVICGFT